MIKNFLTTVVFDSKSNIPLHFFRAIAANGRKIAANGFYWDKLKYCYMYRTHAMNGTIFALGFLSFLL